MYAKITNGSVEKFPYTISELKKDNPTKGFPRKGIEDVLDRYGVVSVTVDPKPTYDEATEVVEMDAPTVTNGEWSVGWTVRAKNQSELDADAARDAIRIARIKEEFDDQRSVNKVLLKICFLQENKIRALEGKSSVTPTEFRNWVDSQID